MIRGAVIFGRAGRAKLLELLAERPMKKFSVNGLARLSGVPLATTWRAARDLARMGFVTLQRDGKELWIQLNHASPAARAIVHASVPDPFMMSFHDFDHEIRARLPKVRVRLFGSVSRGEHNPNSDVDVLVVYRGTGYGKSKVMHAAVETAMAVEDRYGIPIVPLVTARDVPYL